VVARRDRWAYLERASWVAGVLALFVAYFSVAPSQNWPPFSESSTTTTATTATTTNPDIPVIEGEIEHFSTPEGLGDAQEGDILQLDLAANSLRISSPYWREEDTAQRGCGEEAVHSGACQVMWLDECVEAPSEDDLAGDALNLTGCTYRTIMTVNEERTGVPGWLFEDGVYELNGYYVVEATGMQNDNIWMTVRDVPPEEARQIDQ
jgi:hypothetical protein